MYAQPVERIGTRKMAIPAMANRIINVKHVAVSLRRMLSTGIASEPRRRIEQLLCERISLRGICRAVGVSLTWLLHFLVECLTACPDDLQAQPPTPSLAVVMSRLEAEADEMWSFVQKKANKQ